MPPRRARVLGRRQRDRTWQWLRGEARQHPRGGPTGSVRREATHKTGAQPRRSETVNPVSVEHGRLTRGGPTFTAREARNRQA